VEVLFEWARAEEELGDATAAIGVYERLAHAAPQRRDALEALCRLKLQAGDFEGGLAALRVLRDGGTPAEQRTLTLRLARLLLEDLGQPAEAALALIPLLDVTPAIPESFELMARTLADPATSAQVAERLEELAAREDASVARRVFRFLVQTGEGTGTQADARQRWFLRLVELSLPDREAALAAAIEGATELLDAAPLWDQAERLARELDRREVVSSAYHRVLTERTPEASLADSLARRMVAFADEYASDSSRVVEALQGVLEHSPGNRWALDRVKLALGSQARWDELFHLYDMAIGEAIGPERTELLDEAACAAKDLARLPERAIPYLEAIHRLRPGDVSTTTALERLYERQGRTRELAELLAERVAAATGFKRFELHGRIGTLLLDLGDIAPSFQVVERMLEEGAAVSEVIGMLERIAAAPKRGTSEEGPGIVATQRRAIELLRAHYEAEGRADDVIRMAARQLDLADGIDARGRCIRDLVDLHLAPAEGATGRFDRAFPHVEAHVADQPMLARVAFEALLRRALRAWRDAPEDADAQAGAWRAIQALKALLLGAGSARRAVGLLYRCSRLPFEPRRKRELLREAALASASGLGDRDRAIRHFTALFAEDSGDDVASQSVEAFVWLLDTAGEHARLAELWEEQSRIHGRSGNHAEQRACWERAAGLWERQEELPKAIAAYRQAAALSSEAAFEALARIHEGSGDLVHAAEALEWLSAHAPLQERGLRVLRLSRAYVALRDRHRATERLESALNAGVETERADQVSEVLISLYREDSAWRPLAGRLAADSERTADPERKLACLREAAELLRDKLDAPGEAAELLERALTLVPHDATIRSDFADLLESLQRWDRLVEILKDPMAFERDASSRQRAFSHHRLARALTLAGRTDEALGELKLAADLFPSQPTILHDLARAALGAGALDLAESTNRALLLALHHPSEGVEAMTPRRADVFLDLSEIAAQSGDLLRAADLVDSAVDAALDAGDPPERFEPTLASRGRHELRARAIERRLDRATTLAARVTALVDLTALWTTHLQSSSDLKPRIAHHAEGLRRELEREESTDAAVWVSLASVLSAIGDESGRAAMQRRLVTLLKAAIAKTKRGPERAQARVTLAKALLEDASEADDAIPMLTAAMQENPSDGVAAEILADALERRGRLDELVALFEKRLGALEPDAAGFLDASLRLARALERAGRDADALCVYESVFDDVPADAPAFGPLLDRLEALGSEKAAEGLERLVAAERGSADVARRLIAHRERQGDQGALLRALEVGAKVDPGDASIALRLIEFHRTAGNLSEATDALNSALAARPGDSKLLALRSTIREAAGDTEGALSDLEGASAADGSLLDALVSLHGRIDDRSGAPVAAAHTVRMVDLLIGANRSGDARREVDRLLAKNPNYAGALERLASLSSAAKEWDAAIDAYRKLLGMAQESDAEDFSRIVCAMADTCDRAGCPGEARGPLERALHLIPHRLELRQALGRVYEATGEWARLVDLLSTQAEAAETSAARAELLVRAGALVFENAGAPADAMRLAELARAANPDSLDAVLLLAQTMLATGRASEALATLREASERTRGKRSPLTARIMLETAKAHLALDELLEALEQLKAAFASDTRNAEVAALLGLVAMDLDDERTAERALLAVTAVVPRTPADRQMQATAFYQLAVMARGKNDDARARRLAGKALAAQPDHAAASMLVEELGGAGGVGAVARAGVPPAKASVTPRS
jgi:lipopolysaccharide biosynthesis regulator YciM